MPDTETEETTEGTESSDAGKDLGEAGKKALAEERKARRDLEKQLRDSGTSNAELQKRLKDFEDRDKTEIDKANETAAEFRTRMETEAREKAEVKLENQRFRIAAKKGLDPDLWDRVRGTTEEEITKDVESLVEKFSAPTKRPGALRSGASAPDGDKGKRGAAALRGLRRD